MQLDIHNIRLEDAELMTTLGPRANELKRNRVIVKAGDEKSREVVFRGEIFEAYPVIEGGNRYMFRVNAMEGVVDKMAAEEMRTIPGEVSAMSLLEEYAKKMNYAFVNNGVTDVTLCDIETMRPIDDQGITPQGQDMNGILHLATSGLVYLQHGGLGFKFHQPITGPSSAGKLIGLWGEGHGNASATGAFTMTQQGLESLNGSDDVPRNKLDIDMNLSNVTYSAGTSTSTAVYISQANQGPENRPVNIGMTPAIYLGV